MDSILFTLICFYFGFAVAEEKCGYSLCNLGKPGYLNVHLIPHTHDDVGWLKNIDQYFYGTHEYYQQANVELILDSVIHAMMIDRDRKFTYVEMAFFERWWRLQSKHIQDIVRSLIQTGQLEFALGGWSMNDEAVVHYADSIDQMSRGLAFLNATFGACGRPRVAWQIDPFGHAQDQARMFIESGFDAVFFQRMDYREKMLRRNSSTMELLWRPDEIVNSTGLFTHILYQSYCSPPEFCYDSKCSNPPIVDDPMASNYNAKHEALRFIKYARMVAESYRTNHIFVPMGCDFTFENANKNYIGMDRLIRQVNAITNERVNLLYSSPTCYTKAVNQEFNKQNDIPDRYGDFFPYVSGSQSYWTGYYSSRPALKQFVRISSAVLAACEQAHLLNRNVGGQSSWMPRSRTLVNYTSNEVVDNMRRIMGVMQHHDAVTGTEKQHVVDDYIERLYSAVDNCHHLISAVAKVSQPLHQLTTGQFQICNKLNISVCEATAVPYDLDLQMSIYNPLGWKRTQTWLRIPIRVPNVDPIQINITLFDQNTMKLIEFQLVPISNATKRIPERRLALHRGNMELVFQLPDLQQTGFTNFGLRTRRQVKHELPMQRMMRRRQYQLRINQNGEPEFVYRRDCGEDFSLAVGLEYYISSSNKGSNGAYLFNTAESKLIMRKPKTQLIVGDLFTEVQATYSDWAQITCRLYIDNHMEVEWTVGPLPRLGVINTDAIVKYTSRGSDKNPDEFFTDSMGRGLLRRVQNKKLHWNLNLTGNSKYFYENERIEGNYYPIVNRIRVNYESKLCEQIGLGVYTDRAQGGTADADGVHLTVHRSSVVDDGLGVGEPLIERGISGGLVVQGIHTILLGPLKEVENKDAEMAQKVSRPVIPLFRTIDRIKTLPRNQPTVTLLRQPLPKNIHLLTCTQWPIEKGNNFPPISVLLRLENIEKDPKQKPTYLRLETLLTIGMTKRVTEVTLTANQMADVARKNRLDWPTEIKKKEYKSMQQYLVGIKPGQIKTLILDY